MDARNGRTITWKDATIFDGEDGALPKGQSVLDTGTLTPTAGVRSKARKSLVNQSNAPKRVFFGSYNASKIQRAWRDYLAREKIIKELDVTHRMLSAIRIQNFTRNALRRRRLVESLHRISHAALYLSCICRVFIAWQFAWKMSSALRIQKAWRNFKSKSQLLWNIQCQQLIQDAIRTGAATAIQRWTHRQLKDARWRKYIQDSNKEIESLSANTDGGCFDIIAAKDQSAIRICDGSASLSTNARREGHGDGSYWLSP